MSKRRTMLINASSGGARPLRESEGRSAPRQQTDKDRGERELAERGGRAEVRGTGDLRHRGGPGEGAEEGEDLADHAIIMTAPRSEPITRRIPARRMAEVVFFIAGLGAIAGAIGTIALRNPFYSVLSLVAHLLCLAALFLLLRAEFVAAAQVVVYVGAVMVLYVFVAAYVGPQRDGLAAAPGPSLRWASVLFGGALAVELCIALLGTSLTVIGQDGANWFPAFGTAAEIGKLLLTTFLLAFEVASFLLLVAAVGSVVLARRREGLEPAGTISVGDLFSTTERTGTVGEAEQGTMLEAGGQ
jgi:NADH:ubiquinone oxidoreductase subunit 6 (subunit J)